MYRVPPRTGKAQGIGLYPKTIGVSIGSIDVYDRGLRFRPIFHFGRSVKPRPYMCLHDSTHLTTHGQQLRAYRTYEELLLPHQLQEPDTLLDIADTLLHLPETFPAAYLKIYDPIITQCATFRSATAH